MSSRADGRGPGPAAASDFCRQGAEPCQHLHLGRLVAPPHVPAQPFSLLHFLLPAPAQISWNKQSLSPSACGSFVGLNNPALVKHLWAGSLQVLSCTLSFLLLHSVRLRNAAKILKCRGAASLFGRVRCSPPRTAQQAG